MTELTSLASPVAALLRQRKETIAIAESSAGGLISAALLDIGDDDVKGIRSSTEEYARIKARAIRQLLGATWGLAETGASGPTGNRYGDAPGHACFAVAGPVDRALTLETQVADREKNMWAFARAALLLLEAALSETRTP